MDLITDEVIQFEYHVRFFIFNFQFEWILTTSVAGVLMKGYQNLLDIILQKK